MIELSLRVNHQGSGPFGRSQSHDPLTSVAAFMTKIDVDRTFADLDTTSGGSLIRVHQARDDSKGANGTCHSSRERPKARVLKTRIVDSNAALSLFELDDTLYTSGLGQPPVCRVLANHETPMMNPEAPMTTTKASRNELKSENVQPLTPRAVEPAARVRNGRSSLMRA